jgi:uncharacterized membrane protein
MSAQSAKLPHHIESTIADISDVHHEYHQRAHPLQKIVGAVTAWLARPACLIVLTLLVGAWLGINTLLAVRGLHPPDPPPFTLLSCAASVSALYLTTLILATQKHDDALSLHRDQLTLEIALLIDQRSAKILRLLEDRRLAESQDGRDSDPETAAMAVPADPKAVLDKIRAMQARHHG